MNNELKEYMNIKDTEFRLCSLNNKNNFINSFNQRFFLL